MQPNEKRLILNEITLKIMTMRLFVWSTTPVLSAVIKTVTLKMILFTVFGWI